MPETCEPQQAKLNPRYAGLRPFNSQTAREAALKRHKVERLRVEEADRILANPPTAPTQDQRLGLLEEQIARTRIALNTDDLQAHHRAALLRALCDLLDQQRIARGEPLPGSRRPAPERSGHKTAAWIVQPSAPPSVVPPPTPSVPEPKQVLDNATTPQLPKP